MAKCCAGSECEACDSVSRGHSIQTGDLPAHAASDDGGGGGGWNKLKARDA